MKLFHYHVVGLVLIMGMTAQKICAAESVSEQNYLEEFPVVLSASRLSQPLSDAPSAMTVIDRDMIVSSGFRKIPDLFKLVPGMYVSYYGASQAIVSYHGTSDQYARRMQVLIDGRSSYIGPAGDMDWEALPINIDDIERIEVVRGPSAAAYGDNSIQGVINIFTYDASALAGSSVSVTGGNGGILDGSAHVGSRGDKFDYRLTMGYRSDNGYDPNINTDLPPGNDNSNFDSYSTRLLNFRANYHPNYRDNFDVQMGASYGERDVGFTTSSLNIPHEQFAQENFQQLTWQRALDNSDEFQLRYYHLRLSKDETNLSNLTILDQPGLTQITVANNELSDRNDLELQHTLHLGQANRLVWGAAYRSDYEDAPNYFLTSLNDKEYRLFAHDEWHVTPKWLLNAGVMLEHEDNVGTQSSPQVALNYHIIPLHTLRVAVSRAYRNPAMLEEDADWRYPVPPPVQSAFGIQSYQIALASGGLSGEKVISREVGYLGKLPEYNVTIDLRFFHDDFSNLMVPVGVPFPVVGQVWDIVNIQDYLTQNGAEASIEYRFAQTRAIFNYSHNRIGGSPILINEGYAGDMPEEQYSLLLSQGFEDYSVSLNYYNQSSSLPEDRGSTDLQRQHQRTDLRLARSFKAGGSKSGEIALVVQNLFNTDYTEYIATNVFTQRVFAKLTLSF